MARKKDPLDPSEVSAAYLTMAPRVDKMRTVLGGTEAMRAAGTKFLPQHSEEPDRQYEDRLGATTLYNVTKLTLTSWVGTVFEQPVSVSNSLDLRVQELLTDIDLEGNSLDVFAREWFNEGLAAMVAPMLVLFPMGDAPAAGPRTLKDDQVEGRRPFWRRIAVENVLFCRSETLPGGEEIISHLRVADLRIVENGFVDEMVPQILVYGKNTVETWEQVKAKNGRIVWRMVDEVVHDLGQVPLVIYYAEKQGLMVGDSQLSGLADLNIQHWQSSSDQRNCLTVARFPILAGAGVEEDEKITIGSRKFLRTSDPTGKFYYVEHSGAALAAGAADLKAIEDRMANYGAEFLKKRPGRETATARALDSAEATSPIQDAALRFNDALAHALYFTTLWMGLPEPAVDSLCVNTDFSEPVEEDPAAPAVAPDKEKAAA